MNLLLYTILNKLFLGVFIMIKKLKILLSSKHCILALFMFIIFCWLPTFIAFFPGIFNYDGPSQIVSFFQNNISTHHPIIHTALLTFLYSLGSMLFKYPTQGAVLCTLFQIITMASIFSYATKFIYDSTGSLKLTLITLLFFCIFPTNVLLPLMTSKDVIFAGLVLLYIITYFKIIEKPTVSKSDYFNLIIITVLMLLFRNNAIYAFILSGLFWFFLIKKQYRVKFIFLFSICIIMFFICSSFLMNITNASKGSPKEKLSIITQAIGRISKYNLSSLTREEREYINFYFNSTDVLADSYIPYLSDKTKDLLDYNKVLTNKKNFYKFSLSLMLKYPKTSLDSFLATCRGYWNIFDNTFCSISNDEFPNSKGYFEITFYKIHSDAYQLPDYLPTVRKFYVNMFCKNNYINIPIINVAFQPALYFYLLLFYIIFKAFTRNVKDLLPAIFLLIYFISCFFGPCAIVRYVYCVFVCIPIIISKMNANFIKNEVSICLTLIFYYFPVSFFICLEYLSSSAKILFSL